MKNWRLLLLVGTLMVGVFPSAAFGWRVWACDGDLIQWLSDPQVRASKVSFPAGVWRTALSAVIDRWNANPTPRDFNLTFDDPSVRRDNGQNEVWASSDPNVLTARGQRAPAVTYTWDDCGDWFAGNNEIVETDVVFDVNVPWTSGTDKSVMNSYAGKRRPFRTTAMHEFGHALGLLHEDRTYNIMGQDFTHIHTNGSTATAYPGEDAANGVVKLYGLSATPVEDVGVVHWRWTGSDRGYSTHDRTRIFDSTCSGPLSSSTDAGEPRYNVKNGQTICVEFTYENNGSTRQQIVEVGFYLSDNDAITILDTRLGGVTLLDLRRDNVWTRKDVITLPNNLVVGNKFHVGAIVDENNKIAEVDESNNATYLGIKVIEFIP